MMNLASLKAALNSLISKPPNRELLTNELNQLHEVCVHAHATVTELGQEEITIRENTKLSDAGKQDQLKAFGEKSAPKFAMVGRTLNDARTVYARLTNNLIGPITAIPDGVNEVVDFLSLQEGRGGIGRAGAPVAFLKSLEPGGTLEIARALLAAPGPAWVPADIRRRGEEDYARRTNLPVFEKRQSIGHLVDNLEALANLLDLWLRGLGANPETVAKTLNLK
jgi:hypothetical protein